MIEFNKFLSAAVENLKQEMLEESDVETVEDLLPLSPGLFLFWITTPFPTFPKIVIGETDSHMENVKVLFRGGAYVSGSAAWSDELAKRGLL